LSLLLLVSLLLLLLTCIEFL